MKTFENVILDEARRTTHAVRALARFVILQVTYTIVATLLLVPGIFIIVNDPFRGQGGIALIVIGGLLAVAGLIHAISAGFGELSKSTREVV